jgi:transcriptional regulator with XRE-family HTH domain
VSPGSCFPIILRRNSLRPQHSFRYKELLKRLRQARHDAGLTQAEVAEALGTTQGYVSKCEHGERRVDAVELSDFAQVYGTPIDSLLPLSPAPRLAGGARLRRVAERPIRPKSGRRSEPK